MNSRPLPPLSEVIAEFPRAFETERLWFHTGITALEVAIGFPAGVLLAGTKPGQLPRVADDLNRIGTAAEVAQAALFSKFFFASSRLPTASWTRPI